MHHLSLSFDKLCNTLQTYNASGRLMRRLYSAVNFKLKQAQRNRSQNTTHVKLSNDGLKRGVVLGERFVYTEIWRKGLQKKKVSIEGWSILEDSFAWKYWWAGFRKRGFKPSEIPRRVKMNHLSVEASLSPNTAAVIKTVLPVVFFRGPLGFWG